MKLERQIGTLICCVLGLLADAAMAAPANDHFGARTDLGSDAQVTIRASLVGATRQVGEPSHGGVAQQAGSLWYTWEAPANGTLRLENIDVDFSALWAIYQGEALDVLVEKGSRRLDQPLTVVVSSGERVQIAVATPLGVTGVAEFDLVFQSLVNDDFAQRIDLGNLVPVVSESNNRGATFEAGEPAHRGPSFTSSVWWQWTAPASGDVLLSAAVSAGFTFRTLQIYAGDQLQNLEQLDGFDVPFGQVTLRDARVTQGETYHIVVAGGTTASGQGDIRLSVLDLIPLLPGGDRRVDAADLDAVDDIEFITDDSAATVDVDEPDHAGDGMLFERSQWWRWTAPKDGSVRVSSSALRRVAVYDEPGGTLRQVATGERLVRLDVAAGQRLWIATAARDGLAGETRMDLGFSPNNPDGDSFDQGIQLAAATQVTSPIDYSQTYTREAGEPLHEGLAGQLGSAWWRWQATGNLTVVVGSSGLAHAAILAVYSGDELENLTRVAGATAGENATFSAVAGTEYRIALAAPENAALPVNVTLALEASPPPQNDAFAARITLEDSTYVSVAGDNTGATRESDEPADGGQHSVWWRWTAPASSVVAIDAAQDLRVYTGSQLGALERVPVDAAGEFAALGGVEYSIAASSSEAGGYGDFELRLDARAAGAANALFRERQDLGAAPDVQSTGGLAGALREPFEPGVITGDGSAWWRWTATTAGSMALTFSGADDLDVAVFTGDVLGSLEAVASGPARRGLRIPVQAGTDYSIVVFGEMDRNAQPFTFDLRFSDAPPPANDAFAHREVLASGVGVDTSVDLTGATQENGERQHGGAAFPTAAMNSAWFGWTADTDGLVWVQSAPGVVIAAYTGDAVDDLRLVGRAAGDLVFLSSAGTAYRIALSGGTGAVPLLISDAPPAAGNDHFADRIVLGDPMEMVDTFNAGATNELFEQTNDGRAETSLWWQWQNPGLTTAVEIDFSQTTFNAVLEVYKGEEFRTLRRSFGVRVPGTSIYRFVARAGENIYIVASGERAEIGRIRFQLTQLPRPSNDDFADREYLGDSPVATATGDVFGATKESGENNFVQPFDASLWWSWTAPATGRVTIRELRGLPGGDSDFSENILVYRGDELDALRIAAGGREVSFSFTAVAGETYHLAYRHRQPWVFSAATPVSFELDLDTGGVAPPPNDNFADRLDLGAGGSVLLPAVANDLATAETGDPQAGVRSPVHNVWFQWAAPLDGMVRLSTSDSLSVFFAVWTGESLVDLTHVASDWGEVFFQAQQGITYQLSADSSLFRYQRFPLELVQLISNGADDFAGRARLTGETATLVAHTTGLSLELGEFAFSASDTGITDASSAWWQWTAPADGRVRVRLDSGNGMQILAAFSGAAVDLLELIAFASGFSDQILDLPVNAGQEIQFMVGGDGQADHEIVAWLQFAPGSPVQPLIEDPRWRAGDFEFRYAIAHNEGPWAVEFSHDLASWSTLTEGSDYTQSIGAPNAETGTRPIHVRLMRVPSRGYARLRK